MRYDTEVNKKKKKKQGERKIRSNSYNIDGNQIRLYGFSFNDYKSIALSLESYRDLSVNLTLAIKIGRYIFETKRIILVRKYYEIDLHILWFDRRDKNSSMVATLR